VANLTVDWGDPTEGLTPVQKPPRLGEMVMASGIPDVLAALQLSPGFVTATGAHEFGNAWSNAFPGGLLVCPGAAAGAPSLIRTASGSASMSALRDGLELSVALPF
jgi:hypothetical protein